MSKHTRAELEAALRVYNRARDRASATGDWSVWADLFTEDADYVEHAYGVFKGRHQIRNWITKELACAPQVERKF